METMVKHQIADFHVEYMDVTQHWHPESEPFAGGDALLTALYDGWRMLKDVTCETHWFAGMRQTNIYYVDLVRGDERMTMPVTHNPYVDRMLNMGEIHMIFTEFTG
jgi:hypothetical protein